MNSDNAAFTYGQKLYDDKFAWVSSRWNNQLSGSLFQEQQKCLKVVKGKKIALLEQEITTSAGGNTKTSVSKTEKGRYLF